jgi:DNA-binding response OmpR family regulator
MADVLAMTNDVEQANKGHILIVEDDLELAQWIQQFLLGKSFKAAVIGNGNDAVEYIFEHLPDVVILDGMLPGLDGFEVCKRVRTSFSNAIIMLTARDEEIDEVLGLEMGADEYLTKPVRARALLTRINKHLARQQAISESDRQSKLEKPLYLEFGSLCIDKQAMSVRLEGIDTKVSTQEFDLLWLLASRPGEPVSRNELSEQLRGFEYDGFDRTIDLKVSRLRKKLFDTQAEPARIKTVWGKGYLFVKDAW